MVSFWGEGGVQHRGGDQSDCSGQQGQADKGLEGLDGGCEPDLGRSRNQQGAPHRACGQPPLFLFPEFTAPHFGKPINHAPVQCSQKMC